MKLAWDSKYRREHNGQYERPASDPLYHTPEWTKLSRRWRQAHPLCEECKRQGRITPAQCVDHIVPFPICKDFYDESNLQSLCARCNMEKGNRDRKRIQEWKQNNQTTNKIK